MSDLVIVVARVLNTVSEAIAYMLNPAAARMIFAESPEKLTESEIEEKLVELSASMVKSAGLMNEVELGLKARQALVEKLKTEAHTAQQIKDMTKAQQEAISNLLRTEVATEGKKTFWQGAMVNGFFFVAGVVVTLLLK